MALLDWLACACAGVDERAARAVGCVGDDLLTRVAFAATAGHVHDFDDTFADGVAHVSATCAPAALVVAADLGESIGAALQAYAEAFEAMAACAAASHPALYSGGWHPTAVFGSVGAAVATARLLGLTSAERDQAIALALLRTGGTRGAFGSDGKAIQIGFAAAHGVQAARLAHAGARVDVRVLRGELGVEGVLGARVASSTGPGAERAIARNWIKLYPSCLGTHAPIEAALAAQTRGHDLTGGPLTVTVHPTARQAAHLDRVADPLAGKFSIPYCVGLTVAHGPPRLRDFAALSARACAVARSVTVEVDPALPEFGAELRRGRETLARVSGPAGAPGRSVTASDLERKMTDLCGDRLAGILDDLTAPAATVLSAARLSGGEAV